MRMGWKIYILFSVAYTISSFSQVPTQDKCQQADAQLNQNANARIDVSPVYQKYLWDIDAGKIASEVIGKNTVV